jgi:hypothetical protein
MITPHRYASGETFAQWSLILCACLLVLVACGQDTSPPVDSIANKPYFQDSALLAKAWALPVAAHYEKDFQYQMNGAFCGPATAVNLFRSLDVDRFDQENIFENTDVWYWKARVLGITLEEMAALVAENSDYEVRPLRDLSLEDFRQHLRHANDPTHRYLINFNRAPLFGVDIGHHSPIGGYLAEQDLVFVLDVLDEYEPFLVPAERLYEAMNTVDSETGKNRGLIVVRVAAQATTQPREIRQDSGEAARLEPAEL